MTTRTIPPKSPLPLARPAARTEYDLTPEDIKTLTAVGVIPPGTPPDVVLFYSKTCQAMRLTPFKRQLHLISRNVKVKSWAGQGQDRREVEKWEKRYAIQTGIDGYRSRADSTGLYCGSEDYRFDEGLTQHQMIEAGRAQPATCTVTVYKLVGGVRCPFTATAGWKEYCPKGEKDSFMWFKMPFLMLGKVAEALALRKAFPNETSGALVSEELAHIQEDATPQPSDLGPQVDAPSAEPQPSSGPGNPEPANPKAPKPPTAEDETKRKTLVTLLRKRINNPKAEAEVERYFQNVPSQARAFKGQMLLPIGGTLGTMGLAQLEHVVQSFDKWFERCADWCDKNKAPAAPVEAEILP